MFSGAATLGERPLDETAFEQGAGAGRLDAARAAYLEGGLEWVAYIREGHPPHPVITLGSHLTPSITTR